MEDVGGAAKHPQESNRRYKPRKEGGKTPQVCLVWPTETANTAFPSICRAATTCWAEVIWLKVSVVSCSPNVQSQLQRARLSLSIIAHWTGDHLHACSALQNPWSACWQMYAAITLPLPFCSIFSYFTMAPAQWTPHEPAQGIASCCCFPWSHHLNFWEVFSQPYL